MDEFISHYERVAEELRLKQGMGQLELARTQEIILRHLPTVPGVILDVGGAAGVYSDRLGAMGYETHLIDPVPHHVEEARKLANINSASLGDARKLKQTDDSADAVLLLGPLYHLTEREDRLRALREARRVLRPRSVLFAAAINHFASLLDGLARGFIDDPHFATIVEQDLATGQHCNPTDNPDYFTSAFFHRPEELATEIAEAGFEMIELVGIEGPGWLARDFEARWQDAGRRKQLMALLRQVEREPALLGVSLHLMGIAKK